MFKKAAFFYKAMQIRSYTMTYTQPSYTYVMKSVSEEES